MILSTTSAIALILLGAPSAATADTGAADARRASELCRANTAVTYHSDENVLCLMGSIDIEGEMEAAVRAQPVRDQVMVVAESPGGGLMTAIRITEWLEPYHYDIVVSGPCASACAQFLFMGARHKYVIGDGFVGMHGGPMSDEKIDAVASSEEGRVSLRHQNEAFREFYRSRGLDISVTRSPPPRILERIARGEIVFWMPTLAEFEAAGVRDIVTVDSKYLR